VHSPDDIRIYHKMCRTLAARGYRVTFIAPSAEDRIVDEVTIRALPPRSGPIRRFANLFRAFSAALREPASLYHFHDPELIPIGIALKLLGKRVVYDVHEDVPKQILSKHWIPRRLRRGVSLMSWLAESVGACFWDGIVPATPSIARKFPPHKTVMIQNYPLRHEITRPHARPFSERPANVIYAGGISDIRGIRQVIAAMSLLPTSMHSKLLLAGSCQPKSLHEELIQTEGWQAVQFHGWCARDEVQRLMANARAGIVTFLPKPNHISAQPNKLFEYMSAGLPVVASDFPLWRQIIEDADCGILVNPERPSEISHAIQYLISHPQEAEQMGERGRRAVEEKYNWDCQSEILVDFYQNLLSKKPRRTLRRQYTFPGGDCSAGARHAA
jgi:glycosyltransferase involved in cell wall biosynthesis